MASRFQCPYFYGFRCFSFANIPLSSGTSTFVFRHINLCVHAHQPEHTTCHTHNQKASFVHPNEQAFISTLIDANLSMASQVANACRNAYYQLARIARTRDSITTSVCKCLVHAFVTSRIDNGNAMLFGLPNRLLHRLEMVQRSAARIVLQIRRGDRQSMSVTEAIAFATREKAHRIQAISPCTLCALRRHTGVPRLAAASSHAAPYVLAAIYFCTFHVSTSIGTSPSVLKIICYCKCDLSRMFE